MKQKSRPGKATDEQKPDTRTHKQIASSIDKRVKKIAKTVGKPKRMRERIFAFRDTFIGGLALIVAVYGLYIGFTQYRDSGTVYSWFDTGLFAHSVEVTSNEGLVNSRLSGALVVSNAGRTGGTIVALRRNGGNGAMTVCLPTLDESGNLDKNVPVTLGAGPIRLEPGESRLLFTVATDPGQPLRDGSIRESTGDETRTLKAITASGELVGIRKISNPPEEAIAYYGNLPGWFDAMDACNTAVAGD